MNVLVINCGSSSIKYAVYEMPRKRLLAKGTVDRIGQEGSVHTFEREGREQSQEVEAADHRQGVHLILDSALNDGSGRALDHLRIDAVGHRVVHGGHMEDEAVLIDEDVIGRIETFSSMAPLHNPPILAVIRAAMEVLSDVPHAACFDTAFHHTIPEIAYTYALPLEFYRQHEVRRYGFHGISCHSVSEGAAEMLGRPVDELNAVICHLGSGCSITAICHGRSIDTSMGMTPMEGLVMGTRAGDIDPGILFYLTGRGIDARELEATMNHKSGLLGLSGVSPDMRDILDAAHEGDNRARLAVDVFCYHLKKYIGAYIAIVGAIQAIIFTGGIGENSVEVRQKACADMRHLGIEIDARKNETAVHRDVDIAAEGSRIRVLVIAADEELMIAEDTFRLAITRTGAAVV